MAGRGEKLVWLDLEMTGLDPARDAIIQVGLAITELGSFDVLAETEIDVWQPDSALERMTPFVRKMHETSGLTERVRRSQTSLAEAERATLELVARFCGPAQGVLAGNSIWQDRRFIAAAMPALDGYLHFRMVDVTAFKIMARAWLGDRGVFQKEKAHTALEDVRAAMRELQHYKRCFGLASG